MIRRAAITALPDDREDSIDEEFDMKKWFAILALVLLPAPAAAAATPDTAKSVPAAPALVHLETSEGDIFLELDAAKAPKTVKNFLQYVRDGQYEGTVFHRVIAGFMAQGGGFTTDLVEKSTRAPIENESKNGLSNLRGTIAMARTNDPHSATAQWFINLVDNPRLDGKDYKWGYAVFGKVVRGMDVLDDIARIPTGPAGPFQSDVPFRPVIIKKASVIDALPAPEKAAEKDRKAGQ